MFIEIDEEVDATLPAIVDDDGDSLTDITSVEWTSTAAEILVLPNADLMSAIIRATGVPAQGTVKARVTVNGGGYGDYVGDIVVGMGVPVGGTLGLGTARKITP